MTIDINAMMDMLKTASSQAASQTKMEKPSWWHIYTYPEAQNIVPGDLIGFTKKALFFQALLNGTDKVQEFSASQRFTGTKDKFVSELVKDDFARVVYEYSNQTSSGGKSETDLTEWFLVRPNGGIYVQVSDFWNGKGYLNT